MHDLAISQLCRRHIRMNTKCGGVAKIFPTRKSRFLSSLFRLRAHFPHKKVFPYRVSVVTRTTVTNVVGSLATSTTMLRTRTGTGVGAKLFLETKRLMGEDLAATVFAIILKWSSHNATASRQKSSSR